MRSRQLLTKGSYSTHQQQLLLARQTSRDRLTPLICFQHQSRQCCSSSNRGNPLLLSPFYNNITNNNNCGLDMFKRAAQTNIIISRYSSSNSNDDNDHNKNDWDAWIPPPHPLAGDQGQNPTLAAGIDQTELSNEGYDDDAMDTAVSNDKTSIQQQHAPVNWLQSRRARFGNNSSTTTTSNEKNVSTTTTINDIPILEYTLLSRHEILTFLEFFNARDIVITLDTDNRFGGAIGTILCTIDQAVQRKNAVVTIYKHMRARKLHERNVTGAQLGPEGCAIGKGSSNMDDNTWVVIDCRNYVVHVQEERIRRAVDLEKLWSGRDALYSLDVSDEDAVDRYVEDNPVPDDYIRPTFDLQSRLQQLQRTRYTAARKGEQRQQKKKSRGRLRRMR